jgi:hypothetical protein
VALLDFVESLDSTWLGATVKTSIWMFPTLQTVHLFGMCALVGGVAIFDMRVLGVAKGLSLSALRRLLPLSFMGFGANLLTGILFFVSNPIGYEANQAFRIKMLFVLLAGVNALWFELAFGRQVPSWGPGVEAPRAAKTGCFVSLALWASVIIAGRLMPFN